MGLVSRNLQRALSLSLKRWARTDLPGPVVSCFAPIAPRVLPMKSRPQLYAALPLPRR
jgi:hypothetical protein